MSTYCRSSGARQQAEAWIQLSCSMEGHKVESSSLIQLLVPRISVLEHASLEGALYVKSRELDNIVFELRIYISERVRYRYM